MSTWIFLALYAILVFVISPKTVNFAGFFHGIDDKGKETSITMLTASTFISWIFAKSVTNAANLGAKYGIVGGVAYGVYWLCIPLGGLMIYRLRKNYQAKGLVPFLTQNYGAAAAAFFSLAIFIRLFNEVWSNTTVVGEYFGASGSTSFILAAILFTAITAIYSVKGGLRSAIITDFVQTIIFVIFIVITLVVILPKRPFGEYLSSGIWTMEHGVDLILVSFIQIFSYPFHDPVLTDRAFLTDEKKMLKAFFISGIGGFIVIVLFSVVGIYSKLEGLPLTSNIPVQVAGQIGQLMLLFMSIVMMTSAGSTLDSAFSSLSKLLAVDVPHFLNKEISEEKAFKLGKLIIILFAIIGNIPTLFGTNILAATTISGTMVIGLAPIFLLHGICKPTKAGFHLSFWSGMIIGILYTFKLIPACFAIGTGDSAMLLGVNFYGSLICFGLYILSSFIFPSTRTNCCKEC